MTTSRAHPTHAVVVAYHGVTELDECLRSIGDEIRVTVVDNSSSTEVQLISNQRGAEYIDPKRNVGFSSGVNIALRKLQSDSPRDVLLVNPDARLTPSAADELVAYLRNNGNERVAAVSPLLIGTDGEYQRVAWPFPTPARAWQEAVGLGHRGARDTFVIGAVLLLRWEAILEVGLFDERFFLYAEEADWQRRARALGWRSQVCSDVVVSHRGAGTSTDPRRREALFHAGQETYIRKWYGRIGWALYRTAACLGSAARAVVLRGDRRRDAAHRALLYLRGPRRCAAPAQDR